jgi:hypothetical protein
MNQGEVIFLQSANGRSAVLRESSEEHIWDGGEVGVGQCERIEWVEEISNTVRFTLRLSDKLSVHR